MLPKGWKRYELGNVVDLLTGFAFSSKKFVAPGARTVRLLRGDNVMQGYIRWNDARYHPIGGSELARFALRQGDVVIALDRPVTNAGLKCSVVSHDDLPCLLVQRVARLRGSDKLHQSYLAQITQFDSFKFHLLGSKTETAVPHVSPRDLREFAFLAPIETTEQRSIAEVLQVWDVAIATTEKLLINSRTKKRNLMQGLLKSHRSFGRKRVPWSRIDFNRVFERIARKNTNQNTNVLTISGQHGLISQRDFFNKSVASKNLQGYTLLETGDFAYNKSYSNGYPMGAIKPLLNYDSGVVSSLYICFRIRPDIEGDIDFYRHYFEAGMLNDEINGIAQEGARNHGLLNVGVKDFFKLKLHVPPIQEQRRIAEVLNVAEAEERCIVRELDKLKEEKRVLMNDLLTGKRRVKMSDALSSSTV